MLYNVIVSAYNRYKFTKNIYSDYIVYYIKRISIIHMVQIKKIRVYKV